MVTDLQVIPLRHILTEAIEAESLKAEDSKDTEMQEIALRLLTKLAMITNNPETLLIVSYY